MLLKVRQDLSKKMLLNKTTGLTLIGLRTTGPWSINDLLHAYMAKKRTFTCGTNVHGKSQGDKMSQSNLLG